MFKKSKVYLVDTENVSWNGLKGINNIGKKDHVYLFVSKSLEFTKTSGKQMVNFMDFKNQVSIIKVKSGTGIKNYMDFQLATFLGEQIANNPNKEYVIISKDRGFLSLRDYWKGQKVKVQQYTTINDFCNKVKPVV